MELKNHQTLTVQPATREREEYVDRVLAQMITEGRAKSVTRETGDEEDSYELGALYHEILRKIN